MKQSTRKKITAVFLSLATVCLSGCGATARHPGALGQFGDFLQDTPGATFVVALIIWAISNSRRNQ